MNFESIDFKKSIDNKKLVSNKTLVTKIWEHGLIPLHITLLLCIATSYLYNNMVNNENYLSSLFMSLLIFSLLVYVIYFIAKMYNFKELSGISEIENLEVIKQISDNAKWAIKTEDKVSIIEVNELKSFSGYGKQIVILYNENKVFVNCISFALGKTPNPLLYFSNKKILRKFEIEFKNKLK
ncbi:hypothetical protein BTO05_04515 [Winogradskyella sp. PC-19]|uniref:hypothetical protein n=1 Tax=unclassified Winogradskyella TaxID=2615021 RepID=UPI000B3CE4B9|nr:MULTISPECIES: hypothetical protein [unclassified Winogradskyella]ARV08931.1 hypothetical protein BTO05_04515 [Winogradskyella sp. PC-19]